MQLSLLSQVFVTERHRQRAGDVGYAVPGMSEVYYGDAAIEPLLATNMKGSFLRTRVSSSGGYARFGYSAVPVEDEAVLIGELYKVLLDRAPVEGWQNVVSTVPEALVRMRSFGVRPCVILSATATPVDDLLALPAPLPEGAALVVGPAEGAGLHTRIGAHVGILAQRVSTLFVAVRP